MTDADLLLLWQKKNCQNRFRVSFHRDETAAGKSSISSVLISFSLLSLSDFQVFSSKKNGQTHVKPMFFFPLSNGFKLRRGHVRRLLTPLLSPGAPGASGEGLPSEVHEGHPVG